jgi:hypothetical protein
LPQPALQRARARPGALGVVLPEHHAHQPGAPGRVLAAQLAGDLAPARRSARGHPFRPGVARRDRRTARAAEAGAERPHGSLGQAEGAGQGGGRLALLEPLEELLADRDGDWTWHDGILRGRGRMNPDRVIQCRRQSAGKTCCRDSRLTSRRHSRLNLASPDRLLTLPPPLFESAKDTIRHQREHVRSSRATVAEQSMYWIRWGR